MVALRCCFACHMLTQSARERCPNCGTSLPGDGAELIDGRYQQLREIGRGAMGTVVLAEDVALQRRVAIKLAGGDGAVDGYAAQRFYAEAAALATVRNDHVALVHAFGLHGERPFFVMEFVQGASLASLVQAYAPSGEGVPVFRVLSIVRDVARGLGAVHAAGVIHCDVKPSNVVIESRSGRAVLVDFGIAVRQAPTARSGSVPVGTPAYMAPEQIVPDSELSPQTDVYGLACTLYELLTGRMPFQGDSMAGLLASHLNAPPPRLAEIDTSWAPLDPVLSRALAREPGERHESALAFAHAISAALPRYAPADASAPAPLPEMQLRDSATRALAHVMIVDDDRAFALLATQAVKTLFKDGAALLTVARDGTEALELAPVAPQLMVLDQHMPGLAGTDLLALLRDRPGGEAMRVLVCSAAADERALARFRLLGVTDFCPKPVSFRTLLAAIRRLAESTGLVPHDATMTSPPRPG